MKKPHENTLTRYQLQETSQEIVIHQNSSKVDGLGGEVWNGAYTLARFIENSYPDMSGKNVIELGAGCGLVGIVCATLNPRWMVLTDEYPDLLQTNIDQNRSVFGQETQVEAACLTWEDAVPSSYAKAFDFVFGSEITQLGKSLHPVLLEVIIKLIKPCTGIAALSMDVCSWTCEGVCDISRCDASYFVQCAKDLGFHIQKQSSIAMAEQPDIQAHVGINGKKFELDEDDVGAVFVLQHGTQQN